MKKNNNTIKIKFINKTNIIDILQYLKSSLLSFYINKTNEEVLIAENKYKDSKENYNRILNAFKDLCIKLNLTNSLQISILYSYLLWNGYFSKDRKLHYEEENRAIISGLYSYDVMNGNGVCLNFSDLLKDILNKCGFSSSILTAYVKEYPMKSSYKIQIKRHYTNSKNQTVPLLYRSLIKKVGNHAFNLIEENNKFYIYDATNLVLLTLDSINIASIKLGSGKLKIFPRSSYIYNSRVERKTLDNLFLTNKFISPYKGVDYIVTAELCLDLFKQNKKLFEDFHKKIYKDILEISKIVEEHKEKEDIKVKK